ncbi:MAG: ABC transporter permease [Candidatus Sulfotelmatobacter sp.]
MNSQANAVSGSPLGTQESSDTFSATRPLYWCVRRELWEYRSIYLAPLAVAGVSLLGFLIATLGRALSMPDLPQRLAVLEQPYEFAAALPMLAAMVIGAYYCLDAFSSERRDRSILFWKSLPVSDWTTVLAKTGVLFIVLPLITCALIIAVELVMVALSSLVVVGSGMSLAEFWTHVAPFRLLLVLLYHVVTVHVLWHAPFYAWLLLVSSWSRRGAILWAVLPPLAIGVFEKIAFHTTYFANFILYRLEGGPEAMPMGSKSALGLMTHFTPGHFLLSPGLWLGLGFTALCLAGAVRLRHYREPI